MSVGPPQVVGNSNQCRKLSRRPSHLEAEASDLGTSPTMIEGSLPDAARQFVIGKPCAKTSAEPVSALRALLAPEDDQGDDADERNQCKQRPPAGSVGIVKPADGDAKFGQQDR